MWGALFYKVYSGFADNLFEMFELAMLSVQFNRFCRDIKQVFLCNQSLKQMIYVWI